MGLALAFDSFTVNSRFVVPLLPSTAVTSLIDAVGEVSATAARGNSASSIPRTATSTPTRLVHGFACIRGDVAALLDIVSLPLDPSRDRRSLDSACLVRLMHSVEPRDRGVDDEF